MKKISSLIGFIMCWATFINAQQKCDCSIIPYTPKECYDKCVSKVLNEASLEELELILGLEESTAKKIINLRKSGVKTLDAYKMQLSNIELQDVEKSFENINEKKNKYFNIESEERDEVNKDFKKMKIE